MPNSFILKDIGDFLPGAKDGYTCIVSVPYIYHSLGREWVQTLKEEARRERAQAWEEAMQARQDAAATCATAREASAR